VARVLIVDDEGKMRAVLAMALDGEGHEVAEADSGETALTRLETFEPDVVVTDIRMPGMSGLDLLKKIKAGPTPAEVIVMTAYADAASGIEAMRNGAVEYVAKPFEMDEMLLLVRNAEEKRTLSHEVESLRRDARRRHELGRIVGGSRAMQETIKQARIVAGRPTTVLIRGRSGTGKELVARGIHEESGRRGFVAVNCGAIPETLLESELFGHEKGAFTGANERKIGLFEKAGSGTIFLDEIGDLPSRLQVKLLRVLQEREFTRVGGTEPIRSEARVIGATNRNLEEAVKEGTFREDLYYRLSVFPITVPSLVDRVEDIPALVEHFIQKHSENNAMDVDGISSQALDLLMKYDFPGNVRELENIIERALLLTRKDIITSDDLPLTDSHEDRELDLTDRVENYEKGLIRNALEKTNNVKRQAARELGISESTLRYKMKKYFNE